LEEWKNFFFAASRYMKYLKYCGTSTLLSLHFYQTKKITHSQVSEPQPQFRKQIAHLSLEYFSCCSQHPNQRGRGAGLWTLGEEEGTGARMSGEGQRRSRRKPPGFRTPVGRCQAPRTERRPLARGHAPATLRMGARRLAAAALGACLPPHLLGAERVAGGEAGERRREGGKGKIMILQKYMVRHNFCKNIHLSP
jgi:hypothetical protein